MRFFLVLVIGIRVGLCSLPETNMKTLDIISYYGYPAEEIPVETKDGYLLKIHRIPAQLQKRFDGFVKKPPVVFLQHGLLGSSADWILNTPTNSLGFLLADLGFDVWIGNFRGNIYSRSHTNLTIKDEKYWQFSWDEMAKYDLPAMIDMVLHITKRSCIYYIGHSQGTLTMFAMLSQNPVYSQKIRKIFALAPVGRVSHIQGILGFLARHFRLLFPVSSKFQKNYLPLSTNNFLSLRWV
uniref:Abhydro_lipase domain-containing protein n=1 Tax=Dracunculus medinensis TaxID=318479 RepID=A0A0N4UNH8_DRAME